jgi:hypothetical protein
MIYILVGSSLFGAFILMGTYLIYFYNKTKILEEVLQSSFDMTDIAQDRLRDYRKKINQLKIDLIQTYGDSAIIEELFNMDGKPIPALPGQYLRTFK